MKIEEAKEVIKARSKEMAEINAINSFGHIPCQQAIPVNEVINIIDKIELAPPKPPVPQFVADKYEEFKHDFENFLINLCWESRAFESVFNSSDFGKWFKNSENTPLQTLINMHQFGYTVEKEKLYQIIDKRLNATFSCLGYDIEDRVWFWGNKKFFLKNKGVRLAHTRQQLIDAGFEEVFKNPNYEAPEVTE